MHSFVDLSNHIWYFLYLICFCVLGFCTEFNVGGGVIQSHMLAPCNETTVPRCANVYYSSDAYKCKNSSISSCLVKVQLFFIKYFGQIDVFYTTLNVSSFTGLKFHVVTFRIGFNFTENRFFYD